MSQEADQLDEKAESLRQLAEDVRDLLDDAKTYVENQMEDWQGPNRDDVAGSLTTWKTECESVATELENLASSYSSQAEELREEENDDQDD